VPKPKETTDRYEIRLSGSGGQGIILAAIIVAEAVGRYERKYVAQSQSYGPEARGGASRADVVISNSAIDYPKSLSVDLLVAMNKASLDKFYGSLKPDGILIVDSSEVAEIPFPKAIRVPFTRLAKEKCGRSIVANMVVLGTLSYFQDMVSSSALTKALSNRVPPEFLDLNLKAFKIGREYARKNDPRKNNSDSDAEKYKLNDRRKNEDRRKAVENRENSPKKNSKKGKE